jgi:hypothetical protein
MSVAGIQPAAAASDLRPAALQASDAPPGYTGPHTKLFRHYKHHLTMKVGKSGEASCNALPQLKAGWRQGMLQDFTGPGLLNVFEMCAFLQETATQAHAAYVAGLKGVTKQAAKTKGLIITHPSVGDEAIEITGAQSGFATYELVFRRDNVMIELVYLGGSSYTPATFTAVGTTVDSRLQST